ncbi:phosphatase PAP2 family protein [Blastococcus saxobsidens]|uniref:phosphatase PAP2 family protein n=1 Tax=Blastococcus saxobsidens TaxID=138336 RepID=UPI001A911B6F|nr:phosphatase PAP2 family protein [Blastococcus saxobsidens]
MGVTRARAPVAVRPTAIAVAAAAVVALLGARVRTGFGSQLRLDAAVSQPLHAGDGRAVALDRLLEAVTALGLSAVRLLLLLPVAAWLLGRRQWRTSASLRVPQLSQRSLVEHRRAGDRRPGARVAVAVGGGPSGVGRRRVVLVLVAGLTRMWLGVHYLSDVLGGWALGLAWCLLVAVLLDDLPGGRAALPPR